ncbi:MAG: DegT/DnrJ/EryC1/StrS family aminotransferase [Fervidobacterium sp.]
MKYRIFVAEPEIGKDEIEKVTEAVKSGWVSSKGPLIEEFEEKFAKYIGLKHGIATSNGTAALHLALAALNIKRGDEVIIPTLTFASVANAVIYTGARPVFADSHPDYWCINPNELEGKITEKTRVIIPVHLYGHPCDMESVMKTAKKHDIYVIEDCAEAHGAEYKGRKVGTFGDIACFSFYGNKIITTGEGGMCLTNNDELAQKIRILRDHGMNLEKRYWHEVVGFNYRMTNLQAALGVAQLEKINSFIERKRKIAELYNSLLKDVNGVVLHPEMKWAKNIYWLYSILINEKKFGASRDQLMTELAEKGIETRRFFYPIHTMPPYKKYANHSAFHVANELSSKGINLPSSTKLTEENIKEITQLIKCSQSKSFSKTTI